MVISFPSFNNVLIVPRNAFPGFRAFCLSCFCEIWALCVSLIPYDHLYYAPCLVCWVLFDSLVLPMCSRTSCASVHELPQSHCGDSHCFHDNIYIILILLLWDFSTLCVVDHLLPLITYYHIYQWIDEHVQKKQKPWI